ncbi:MAG: methylenetetrahydrofolate reductase [Sedimentisphaerales bacterium]|nr:methylenetetrahydrofolate reductase [Sedimentisphaerales bacterium]
MKPDSKLAQKIEKGEFVLTAELLPQAQTDGQAVLAVSKALSGNGIAAVNVADNHYGIVMSSMAASAALTRDGVEPVFQMVTRDRNRIALQSDLMGAAFLGIKNVLCLTGYHQSLTGNEASANVFDIDSIQLIALVKRMRDEGCLLEGTAFTGEFGMLIGAVANPFMTPLELNMIRLAKKVEAGADFIQTHAIFDIEKFEAWMTAACREGITEKAAILAGVMPLDSADEAKKHGDMFTDFVIPDNVLERLEGAGNAEAQKQEGLAIFAETVQKLKTIKGLRGIHILSGGKETRIPELLAAVELK